MPSGMKLRTAVASAAVGLALTSAIAGSVAVAGSPPTATTAGKRNCGIQTYRSGDAVARDRVWVLRGHVTCKRARKVLRDFFAGKGKHHDKPGEGMAGVTVTVDGWTCSYFAGGGACAKGPATQPTASIESVDASV